MAWHAEGTRQEAGGSDCSDTGKGRNGPLQNRTSCCEELDAHLYQSIDKFVRKQLGNDAIDEVKAINLFAKQIDVFDLRYLEPFPELEILHLGMNRIDDEDLTHLPSFRKLRVLTLQVTRVTDEGLPELHRFRTLERLILPSDGEQVSEAAIVRLRKALPNCDIEQ